jgi:uncharacterized small protein (DUF1192 family)
MTYRYAISGESYEDLASGRVLRSAPEHPAFPVRLGREMFEQAVALLSPSDASRPWVLYDPCCGSGVLITTLGLLYGNQLAAIAASDVNGEAVRLAEQNLSLLTQAGLDARIAALEDKLHAFAKRAHADAIASAYVLRGLLVADPPPVRCFKADARQREALHIGLGGLFPDLVVSDVPYGRVADWRDAHGSPVEPRAAISHMLDSLLAVTSARCVVALGTPREANIDHAAYDRRRQFKIGKRRITWLVRR